MQVTITRQHYNDNAGVGCIFFSFASFSNKLHPDVEPYYANVIYPAPALPPVMSWLPQKVPPQPSSFHYDQHQLRWDAPVVTGLRSWYSILTCTVLLSFKMQNDDCVDRAIYRSQNSGTSWQLVAVLGVQSLSWSPSTATTGDQFALRAVSPLAIEGPASYVTI
jgi:hypothetical protein